MVASSWDGKKTRASCDSEPSWWGRRVTLVTIGTVEEVLARALWMVCRVGVVGQRNMMFVMAVGGLGLIGVVVVHSFFRRGKVTTNSWLVVWESWDMVSPRLG